MRRVARLLSILAGLAIGLVAVWSVVIGPEAAWRVVTNGTTTVWDHLAYPGRQLRAGPVPAPWPVARVGLDLDDVLVDGQPVALPDLLDRSGSLAFLVVRDGAIVHEWYADGHDAATPSMLFSVTKSVLSLLIGAAIDDGLIGSVDDPVTVYLPELSDAGFDEVSLRDLLRMGSAVAYVENDNPFGIHVRFNYTAHLEEAILGLRVRDTGERGFTYRSGDNALLGLVLTRVLGERSATDYLQERLWDPLGMEHDGTWSTDHDGGLERTWCCLAATARDLARIGQLALDRGEWDGQRIIAADWFDASFAANYAAGGWPDDYAASPLVDYGYQWWLTDEAVVALGKDGQYLYVDPARRMVIVRLGSSSGSHSWLAVLQQVAAG